MTPKLISLILGEVFDKAYDSPREMKKSILDEICEKYNLNSQEEEFKIWNVEDIKKCPEGSIFEHCDLGRFIVSRRKNGSFYVVFSSGGRSNINSNLSPWDKKIKLISLENTSFQLAESFQI